jgi:ADP-ribosyl-[dinitrogen reductase] hydrolase
VDAVVSLCRVPDGDLPVGVEQIDVRLIDDVGSDDNANLDLVLTDTVRLIEQLRLEGRTVFLHCVAAQSRTPTVAALYGARLRNISADEALRDITAVLPRAYPNSAFRAALQRLAAGPDPAILSAQQRDRTAASPHQKGRATDD